MAERVGFEPTVQLPVRRISSAVLSTTQPPLRYLKALAAGVAGQGRGGRLDAVSTGWKSSILVQVE